MEYKTKAANAKAWFIHEKFYPEIIEEVIKLTNYRVRVQVSTPFVFMHESIAWENCLNKWVVLMENQEILLLTTKQFSSLFVNA